MVRKELLGRYFFSCQWCRFDGRCVLKHHEVLGLPAGPGVDATPHPGHEHIGWAYSAFQENMSRGRCTGRVLATESIFFPLQCECGTVIDSECAKLEPNKQGKRRFRVAMRLKRKNRDGRTLSQETLEELNAICPPDPTYPR